MGSRRNEPSQPRPHLLMNHQTVTYGNGPLRNNASARTAHDDNKHGRPAPYPHIKDLQYKAQIAIEECGAYMPIGKLLDVAEGAAKRVETDVSFKRPDMAYVEYLISSEILINIIPKSKDYVSISADRSDWQRRYSALYKQNVSQNPMIRQICDMILESNARSGIIPQATGRVAKDEAHPKAEREVTLSSPRPLSMPGSQTTYLAENDELFLNGGMGGSSASKQIPIRRASASRQSSPFRRERPAVQPKPPNLRLHPIQLNEISYGQKEDDDQVGESFARLSVQQNDDPGVQKSGIQQRGSTDGSAPSIRRALSSGTPAITSHTSQNILQPTSSPTKPSGPRSMPKSSAIPVIPPKIPLSPLANEQHQTLPQPPKPAYDPTKSTVESSNSKSPSLNQHPSIIRKDDRLSRPVNRSSSPLRLANGVTPPSRSSSMQPLQKVIRAAELYDQFHEANVLVIDVRSREDFDTGHILAKSIICVEPVGIRSGMSTEELEERLINSPSSEQALFERINKFELVVYYDQCTQTDRFLSGPPTLTEANHLRALHDTLVEFNDSKPLRKRPLMLMGGLEAWIDLVGLQALATSTTIAPGGISSLCRGHGNPRKPITRLLSASANSSLEVRKRRLREQKPLDPDEERTWLEKAHQEEVNPPAYQKDHSDGEADRDEKAAERPSPFFHSYEDYFRRVPEPVAVQQTNDATSYAPRKAPPSVRPPPPPEPIPSVPSRPAPAAQRPSYGGVSDQSTSQYAPVSRQTSAAQQPLYTSRNVSRYRKLPRTGLVNFSVTCYMNATIQCLLATIPLSQFFLGDHWRNYTQKNWKGSNGILPEYFANLIRSLWADDNRPVRPSSLRSFCARLKDEWGIDRQQDAKEFFDFIVDCLHEDLNVNHDRTPLRPLTARDERVRESWPVQKAAKMEWERYSHRESSYISDLFAGQHASRLRCTTCNSTSTTYEPFYSISVEITRQGSRKSMWDIHTCLRSYCQEEKLSGDEVWKCPHCKKEREATKQITITRAPQFLVVHFKRFEMKRGDAKKVHTPINFPLYGFDLGDYMLRSDASSASTVQENPDMATTPPYLYDCYAVMRHIGNTLSGGHYIAFVRDAVRGCWRKFDDERVSDIDPAKLKGDKALQNEQAYLVFYGRAAPR